MPNYNLNNILRPGVLQEISPGLLLEFLRRYQAVFQQAAIALPASPTQEDIPYRDLTGFFGRMEPDAHPDLANALFYVNELIGNQNQEALVEACIEHQVATEEEDTSADLALRLWLSNPSLVERLHSEALVYSCQRFDYFRPETGSPGAFAQPPQTLLDQMASRLDDWFDRKKRGRGCRIYCYENSGIFRFLVLHGEPFARVPVFSEDDGSAIHFRPAKYDVLTYNPATGEIGVNTQLKGLRQEYLNVFGEYLFGDEEHFPDSLKYTLEPIARNGAASVETGTFCEYFDSIRLVELHVALGGMFNAVDVYKADDVIADCASRHRAIPATGLFKAKFSVKFAGEKRPRLITIQPPRTAKMTRESDSLVLENWLIQRGFILDTTTNAQTEEAGEGMGSA